MELLNNHARVLQCLLRDSSMRLRDVAEQTALTERAVQRLVTELEEGGLLSRERDGRRNHYRVHKAPLRKITKDLIALLGPESAPPPIPMSLAPPVRCEEPSREPSFLD
ncbi:MAG: helix-turn-helix domain-containing protein [Deltaproteobacteria bacterium]|nr:helix-turn-helix domain-containing protein [Deltaproteobacteria bacterium]